MEIIMNIKNERMKKIYPLFCTLLFLLFGSITACDDGSLSHDDVYIPDPVSTAHPRALYI